MAACADHGSERVRDSRLERAERFLVDLIQNPDPRPIRDWRIHLLLGVLRFASRGYHAVVQLRLFLYENGIFRHHALGCQVISVGNLTVGGTGKTPVVEVFARELQRMGRKVAILSRGYKKVEPPFWERLVNFVLLREGRLPPRVVSDGRTLLLDSAMSGDEPYMLASNLPDVCVLVDKDRVKSGRHAITRLGCDTLVLDDGFQYLALRHRMQIVLVDSGCPFGNGHVLPRGLLREPIRNLRRADFIFITKCAKPNNEELKKRIRAYNPRAEIIECAHRARYLQNVFTTGREGLDFLQGKAVLAVSGIAAPEGFEREIERRGACLLDRIRFADHHRYTQQQLIDIINRARALDARAILTTEKDAVRFPHLERMDVPVFFLRVEIELLSGAEDFRACLARICFREP
jgi:tetraacyldisaccharide 4'-kinase